MNRKEFMRKLEENLFGLSSKEIQEILEDYEEHFIIGKKKKRSEIEIAASLGDPKKIARDIKKELNKDGSNVFLGAEEMIGKGISETKKFFNDASKKINGKSSNKNWKGNPKVILFNLGVLVLAICWFCFLINIIFSGAFLGFVFGVLLFIFSVIFIKAQMQEKKNSKYLMNFKGKWAIYLILVLINLLLVFPFFWINIFFFGMVVASFCGIAAGIVGSLFGLFMVALPGKFILEGLLFSGIFIGLFVSCLSGIVLILAIKLIKLFYKLFLKYLELNKRLLEDKNEKRK